MERHGLPRDGDRIVESKPCLALELKLVGRTTAPPDTVRVYPSAQTEAPNARMLTRLLRTQCLIDTSELPRDFVRRPDKRCSPRVTRSHAA